MSIRDIILWIVFFVLLGLWLAFPRRKLRPQEQLLLDAALYAKELVDHGMPQQEALKSAQELYQIDPRQLHKPNP